jgi:hypothetical protein
MSLPQPAYTIRAENFAPGYLDSPRTDRLPLGATPDARNAFFYDVEVHEKGPAATTGKRPGSRLITPAAISLGDPVDLSEFRRENAAGALLGFCNGAWSVFDEVSAFTPIASATGYTGDVGRLVVAKNQAFLHDGTKQQLYDGSTVRDVGFVKPTGVTNMTLGGSPGVTGTYSARYTWYDQTHNHESSPTVDETADLVTTNDERVHTKPSGSPPAWVTHWRAYVRREDTNEVYWMRVGTVAIGTATLTEAIPDGARVDRLPLEAENDPPSVAFAVMAMFKGYAIGFPVDSSDMHVSKQGDFESWNPKDVFKVSAGDGEPVRSVRPLGTEIVIQKPHKSWHLVGARVPFDIEELHSSFGNVSQEAGCEVKGRYFAWDEIKGPYWTDLNNWEPIGDLRIGRLLGTLNRSQLAGIRAVHDEQHSLVIWAVPTIGSARRRTLLAYHYVLQAWLPPITGLEYASLAQYTTVAGILGVYAGDAWGRVWRLFDGTRDAPSTGTVQGTVSDTGATSNTLEDDTATFYTTGDGLAGVPVAVLSPAGVWQWRRIASNTATVLTLDTVNDTAWTTRPQGPSGSTPGWTYIIGGIQWYQWTPWLDAGEPGRQKKAWLLEVQLKPASSQHVIEVRARFNDDEGITGNQEFTFSTGLTGGIWGVGLWGVMLWGSLNRRMRKARIMRAFFSMQIVFSNFYPDQPIEMTSYVVTADPLLRRRVGGAA